MNMLGASFGTVMTNSPREEMESNMRRIPLRRMTL
jgi:hypothetical protein